MSEPSVTLTITERLINLSKATSQTEANAACSSRGGDTRTVKVDPFELQSLWKSWSALNKASAGDPELTEQVKSDKFELTWADKEFRDMKRAADEFNATTGQSEQSVAETHDI
jgi:hypothetical protein